MLSLFGPRGRNRKAAMRILIIEDEDSLLNQLKDQLKQEGYAVDGAADGESGLHLATEYPFDAAVVDLGLPRLSGIDVIRRTRAAGKAFPILILTARGRWQEKVEGLEAGADDYLVSPFTWKNCWRGSAPWCGALRAGRSRCCNAGRCGSTLPPTRSASMVPPSSSPPTNTKCSNTSCCTPAKSSPRPTSPSTSTNRTSTATAM